MKLYCDICREKSDDAIHLPLYVSGSEGIVVCLSCRIVLTKVAEGMKHSATKAYMQGFKHSKRVDSAKKLSDQLDFSLSR